MTIQAIRPTTIESTGAPGVPIQTFEETLHGTLIRPGDTGYDGARQVYNAMIDKRPALIARVADTADVIASITFAREQGLTVAVRGGGHSGAGLGLVDDGLVIDLSVAQVIVAELGIDMSRFPSAAHAASWAGLAPGKNESAGKNRSGKTPPGNRHLKQALIQAAQAAGRSRDTYLAAQFRRLAARRGKKRAAVAVAHSILVIAYHLLRDGTEYRELGGDYFDKRNQEQLQRSLVKRLEGLGLKVSLEPAAVAA